MKAVFRSVFKVLPSFIILSTIACVMGRLIFRLPHGMLGVAASVPLTVLFLYSRLLILLVPRTRPVQELGIEKPSFVKDVLMFLVVLLAVICAILIPSAGIYKHIGFAELVVPVVKTGLLAGFLAITIFLFDVLVAVVSAISFRQFIRYGCDTIIRWFWGTLRAPGEIVTTLRHLHSA